MSIFNPNAVAQYYPPQQQGINMLAMALQQYGQENQQAAPRQVTPDQLMNQNPQQNNFGQTPGQAFVGAQPGQFPPVFQAGSMMPKMIGGQ